MLRFRLAVLRLAVFFLALLAPVLAFAQAVIDPEADLGGFLGQVLAAVRGGQWILVVSLVVLGLVFAARRWGAQVIPFLGTSRGGAVLSGVAALVTTLATTLLAGASLSAGVVIDAVIVALVASGLWSTGKAAAGK